MKMSTLPDLVKVLVIGSGGREHAFVWKFAQSPRVVALWCAPGNILIAQECLARNNELVQCVPIDVNDAKTLIEFGMQNRVDLFVIGPEAPLFAGVSDRLRAADFAVFAPSQAAAYLEQSKKFFQEFAGTYGVPVPAGHWFTEVEPAMDFASGFNYGVAVKCSDPCEGKGVTMCDAEEDVRSALIANVIKGRFNGAGKTTVIQEREIGTEASLHALIAEGSLGALTSSSIVPFDSCKDHKTVEDGDKGLLGGGSGTVSPHPSLSYAEVKEISRQIVVPICRGLADVGISYCGPIFPGLMLTPRGPKALECNARFGDPETQVYMSRLMGDFVAIIEKCLDGTLELRHLRWDTRVAVCVIMMAKGYPVLHKEQAGKLILGLDEVLRWSDIKVFGAGVGKNAAGQFIVAGGRVLGVTALAPTLEKARQRVYEAVCYIDAASKDKWAHFRRDIGGEPIGN